jgi:hypothetical protein
VTRMRPDQTDVPIVAVDLDGTLAEPVWNVPGRKLSIGLPIKSGFEKLEKIVAAGWEPVIHTSRAWWAYDDIKTFMEMNGYPNIRIICGKFLAAAYIDDRAINATDSDWTPQPFV